MRAASALVLAGLAPLRSATDADLRAKGGTMIWQCCFVVMILGAPLKALAQQDATPAKQKTGQQASQAASAFDLQVDAWYEENR